MIKEIGLIAFFCCSFFAAFSQIETVRIGVNGLTCSQCTRSVEKKLRQLSFIQDVSMDLANTSGEIHLRTGVAFRPEAIAKAIRDAGFSVRYVHLLLRDPAAYPPSENCLTVSGLNLQLIGAVPPITEKAWAIQLQGPLFGGRKVPPVKAGCGTATLLAIILQDK